MPIIEVDDLCLAYLSPHFRCDKEGGHYTDCAHTHSDPKLCKYMDSFGEDLKKIHHQVKSFDKAPQPTWHGGMM
jgi:hypothetical protein